MHSKSAVTIHLTTSGIDAYCRDLARRSPTLEKRVSAIDALITFVSSQTDTGEQVKPEFQAIKKLLLGHFDEAREALLRERAQRLQDALASRRLPYIAILYASVSRDAFWALLGRVEQRLDEGTVDALRDWAAGWLTQARGRAVDASPYPDVVDFNAAGTDASEYLAMCDLCRYLGVGV